jgi:hypothetical protein
MLISYDGRLPRIYNTMIRATKEKRGLYSGRPASSVAKLSNASEVSFSAIHFF